jgi:glycerol-3-phosphate acyltransferase PlsY
MTAVFISAILPAYLLGSIPFGLIIARLYGKDLRTIGSGNIGATNVARALGRRWAYFCFVLDVLKGLVPMLIAKVLAGAFEPTPGLLFLWLLVGCAAISGHIFPVYLKFKGGKGVATSLGVGLGLWPYYTICALVVFVIWAVVVLVSRYVSLASITASVAFPVVLVLAIALTPGWEFTILWPLLIAAVVMPMMVIIRHRDNIKRLLSGTESKVFNR